MAYTRVVQAGDTIELYKYSKNYVPTRKRNYVRNKRRKTSDNKRVLTISFRSTRSIQRARANFFRLVDANLSSTQNLTFLTLTFYEDVPIQVGYLALTKYFIPSLKKKYNADIKYIAVPEWQERGNLHFHVLVWGLGKRVPKKERGTRNIQRLWARGFIDIRNSYSTSSAIAGYMAKYLVKGLENPLLSNRRAYSCSRNIQRPTAAGLNSLDDYLALIVPSEDNLTVEHAKVYDTLWLGRCVYKKYKKKKDI